MDEYWLLIANTYKTYVIITCFYKFRCRTYSPNLLVMVSVISVYVSKLGNAHKSIYASVSRNYRKFYFGTML